MVIKIKIQLTFLIKFCVTDLAVSTSVIVNMSRFIPRIVLDHNGHFYKYTAVVKESQCTMLLSKTHFAKILAIFLYQKKNQTIPGWLILWLHFDTFNSQQELKMTETDGDDVCFFLPRNFCRATQANPILIFIVFTQISNVFFVRLIWSDIFKSYDISLYLELCNLLQRTDKNLN